MTMTTNRQMDKKSRKNHNIAPETSSTERCRLPFVETNAAPRPRLA
jgi:hypothetical protein